MFTAKVYSVMLGSLSGAMEEVYLAKETIRKWNQQNAERTGKLFMLVEWTAKEEIIPHVDVVIGIVGNWIEKTRFIESCVEKGIQVMLFFNASQNPNNTMQSEQEQVKAFSDRVQDHNYCASFHELNELCALLNDQMTSF